MARTRGRITRACGRSNWAAGRRPAASPRRAPARAAWYDPAMGDSDAVRAAHDKAFTLYAGVQTPHRSCGICLAETFGLRTAPYQALRRGGLDGRGECGALKAGELVLGELLGDPDPTGPVTPELRTAMQRYGAHWRTRLAGVVGESHICNDLTTPQGDFQGEARRSLCTRLAAEAAAAVAQTLEEAGLPSPVTPFAPERSPEPGR